MERMPLVCKEVSGSRVNEDDMNKHSTPPSLMLLGNLYYFYKKTSIFKADSI